MLTTLITLPYNPPGDALGLLSEDNRFRGIAAAIPTLPSLLPAVAAAAARWPVPAAVLDAASPAVRYRVESNAFIHASFACQASDSGRRVPSSHDSVLTVLTGSHNRRYGMFSACDAALACSGTVTAQLVRIDSGISSSFSPTSFGFPIVSDTSCSSGNYFFSPQAVAGLPAIVSYRTSAVTEVRGGKQQAQSSRRHVNQPAYQPGLSFSSAVRHRPPPPAAVGGAAACARPSCVPPQPRPRARSGAGGSVPPCHAREACCEARCVFFHSPE